MPVKIATYNLNNLFERAKIMELSSPNGEAFSAKSKEVLSDVSKLCSLLEKKSYEGNTGDEIKSYLSKYFINEKFKKENYFSINEIRGKLFSITKTKKIELKAKGKDDWLGFVEFTKVRTNDKAVVNTARVLNAVDADVVCTVEVDNRIALRNFNDMMKREFNKSYKHYMLIDGNDDRGIDVGILSKHPVTDINSHVDDEYEGKDGKMYKIFSRDCAEYAIQLNGMKLYLLCNHFKSKGYGSPVTSNAKRQKQAERVVKILEKYDLTKDYVVVAGDFNDTPDSDPLKKLVNLPNLKDVLKWKKFKGETWTYHSGNQQIDYLLVSKPLFDAITEVGIERRGIFKKNNPTFPELKNKVEEASDHACVWATFNI
jgi:endonuclease/exonuclease/phosphatase family metal-dependent hydrolase